MKKNFLFFYFFLIFFFICDTHANETHVTVKIQGKLNCERVLGDPDERKGGIFLSATEQTLEGSVWQNYVIKQESFRGKKLVLTKDRNQVNGHHFTEQSIPLLYEVGFFHTDDPSRALIQITYSNNDHPEHDLRMSLPERFPSPSFQLTFPKVLEFEFEGVFQVGDWSSFVSGKEVQIGLSQDDNGSDRFERQVNNYGFHLACEAQKNIDQYLGDLQISLEEPQAKFSHSIIHCPSFRGTRNSMHMGRMRLASQFEASWSFIEPPF